MTIRQIPFMIFAVLLYFILVSLAGMDLGRVLLTVPLPSGARMELKLGEFIVLLAAIFGFVELINSTNATASAILNHGLSLGVFLVCLLLLLLAPRFGTGTFLVITLMALIDTVAGYSISIMRARRDFSMERASE
jgi:hypothetical protein